MNLKLVCNKNTLFYLHTSLHILCEAQTHLFVLFQSRHHHHGLGNLYEKKAFSLKSLHQFFVSGEMGMAHRA